MKMNDNLVTKDGEIQEIKNITDLYCVDDTEQEGKGVKCRWTHKDGTEGEIPKGVLQTRIFNQEVDTISNDFAAAGVDTHKVSLEDGKTMDCDVDFVGNNQTTLFCK